VDQDGTEGERERERKTERGRGRGRERERERERTRARETVTGEYGGGMDGGCHNHRDASNHPQPPTPSGFGRTDEGLKGSRKRGMTVRGRVGGREREREREREQPIIARLSAGATSS